MLSFLKKWFEPRRGKRHGSGIPTDPMLNLGPAAGPVSSSPVIPKADVHRLMIRATGIRKKKGYHEAVLFLQNVAGNYLQEENTALVACVNKLVPYMKKDAELTYEQTRQWLETLINQLPAHNPYFLNIHITMAELYQVESTEKAIDYLQQFLKKYPPAVDTYFHLIRLAEFYGEEGNRGQAYECLNIAKTLWQPSLDRFRLIKMQRRWHNSAALLALENNNRKYLQDYFFHLFAGFALDMARVLDPAQIEEFHKRKDQYYKGERGFTDTTVFEQAMEDMNLTNRRKRLIRDIYGFVFEEMPLLLGVTEKQLHFHPGDPESLEEVREKKLFSDHPFTQEKELENRIRKIVNKI